MAKIIAFKSIEEMKSQESSVKRRISPEQALLNTLELMDLMSTSSTPQKKPAYYHKIKWVDLKP